MRAVLDMTDAAYYLHMTEVALRELVKQGQVPYKKRGDKLMFVIRDLDAWLDALPGVSVKQALANAPAGRGRGACTTVVQGWCGPFW